MESLEGLKKGEPGGERSKECLEGKGMRMVGKDGVEKVWAGEGECEVGWGEVGREVVENFGENVRRKMMQPEVGRVCSGHHSKLHRLS